MPNMDNNSDVYLNVPVTDAERLEAKRGQARDDGTERLLDEAGSQQFDNDPRISRFPSIHPPGSRFTALPRTLRPEPARYEPISPIEEEDVDAIPLSQRFNSQAERSYLNLEPLPSLWIPIWLRRITLGLFAFFFIIFVIILVVLEFRSRTNHGFYVASSTNHYAWTYAPTIILVILVALWRQVDYSCKLLVPWDELQNGPVKASRSLLLDYISPFQLISLFEAFKQGHIPIIVTIIGFMLLKVITLFSTGLLVLLPTTISNSDFPVTVTSKFDASSFDPQSDLNPSTFPPSSVYAYYGNLAQGLPLPDGVALGMAYIPLGFDLNSGTAPPSNATIFGEVDAFVPIMDCHEMEVHVDGPTTIEGSTSDNAYGTSDSVSLILQDGDICDHWSYVEIPAQNPQLEIVPDQQITGTWQNVFCSVNDDSQVDFSKGPDAVLYSLSEIHYKQDLFANASALAGGSFVIANNTSRSVVRMTNVICKPSYTIGRVNVTNHTTTTNSRSDIVSLSSTETSDNRTLSGLSNWNTSTLFQTNVYAAGSLFGNPDESENARASTTLFTLMALNYQTRDISVLFDSEKLIKAAQHTYKGILSQYAAQSLTSPSNDNLEGATVTFKQNRLHFSEVSLGFMITGFGLLAIISIALIFIAPQAVVPRDPNSIASLATTLARSIELNRLLRRRGFPNEQNQRHALVGYEFGTAIATTESGSSSFKIVTSEGEHDGTILPSSTTGLKWWFPITATIPVFVIAIVMPIAIIISLEILQRRSDQNHGLYSVSDTKTTNEYARYIPALIMLIIATLVNMLDFNIALFSPWSKLSHGNATSKESILNHIVGKFPPFAFFEALKSRSLSVIASLTAAAFASILVIIVSGLYTVENYSSIGPNFTIHRLDNFQLKLPNSYSNDNGAGAITNILEHMDLEYPEFTYGSLVLPKFSLEHSLAPDDSRSDISGLMSAVLPALRANLKCDIITDSAISVKTAKAGETAYYSDQAFVTVQADLPSTCKLGGYAGDQSSFSIQTNFELPSGGQSTYGGKQLDLLFGENSTLFGNYGEDHGPYIGDNPPVGCPSFAFTFGHFQLDKPDNKQVTAMVCYQQIQQVHANFTFHVNSTNIDTQHPPVVDESSIELQTNPNSTIGSKSFDFRIQNNLARQMTTFNTAKGTAAEDTTLTNTFDIFFQAAINGSTKHDPATLAGQQNEQKLFNVIQKFYRIYMAQVINANMRESTSSSSSSLDNGNNEGQLQSRQTSSTILGDMSTTISTPRLIQHNGSKTALQVFLVITILCIAAAYLKTKMRHVLPCNPCGIAGTMSLLAGSDLCHTHDDGICECCGRPRRRSFGERFESIHSNAEAQISVAAEDDDDYDQEGEREQIIPDGFEWRHERTFRTAFAGKRYSMGWWREKRTQGRRRRFGVDIGSRADGSDDQDWELGQRKPAGEAFGDFMMHGARDGRGIYHVQQEGRGRHSPDQMIGVAYSTGSVRGPRRGRGVSMSGMDGEA